MSVDPVVQGLELSKQYLSQLHDYVKSQILATFLDHIPGVDIIGQSIEAQLSQAINVIAAAENEIKTQIEPKLTSALPNTVTTIIGIAEAVQTDISELVGNIATTEDVLTTAITTIKAHAPELARWIHDNVSGSFGAMTLAILKEMEGQEPDGINAVLDAVLKLPNQPAWFTELTTGFRHRGAEWQALALPALLVGAIIGAVQAMQEPFQTDIRQESFAQMPTREADPPTLIAAYQRGVLSQSVFHSKMSHHGFNTDVADLTFGVSHELSDPDTITRAYIRGDVTKSFWENELQARGISTDRANIIWQAAIPLLPEDAIRQSFLRQLITQEEHDKELGQYGYNPLQAQRMRQLYFYIPGPQDLIHMGIRNVFSPDIVKKFQLDADMPEAFVTAAHQQGISADWAAKFWQAHWVMPGREAFFEMYQRTVDRPLDASANEIELSDGTKVYNIIGRDTLNLALKDIDTPPFYRDKLTQVAYRPLTRIDIRRLNKIGLLSKAGVERAYLDLGYNLEHAKLLAEFTESLNATTTKTQAQTLVTNLQRHVIQLFMQDKLSQEEVTSTLHDLGFSAAETKIYLEEAKLVRAAEYSTAIETGVGRLYTTGRITDKDAIQRLRDADVPDDAIATLMAKWDLAIEYRELPPHVHVHRDLTANEILESLVDGTIDESTAETMLEDVGYDKNGADTRIGLALYRASKAAKRIQLDAIKASYINGVIEQSEASNRLDALYLPSDQRDGYLAEWSLARETRTERIPIATLRDMVKGNYLSEDDALIHLKRHRFTDDDARLLLRFWSNQPAPKGLRNVPSAGS